MSIKNQELMLRQFAEANGFHNLEIYFDDGFTGTNFQRPGFQRMMADIEMGKVSVVLVKDLSRLGRHDWQTAMHFDHILRSGCRFIAPHDGVDSDKPETLEFIPFKNLFNAHYARETSRKVRLQKRSSALAGKRLGGIPCYGYRMGAEKKWEIDPETSPVVTEIYELYIQGYGIRNIADILTERGIKTPSEVNIARGISKRTLPKTATHWTWSRTTVGKILSDEVYLGVMITLRQTTRSHTDKRAFHRPENEWVKTPNAHPAIISKELFETVQRLKENGRRRFTHGNKKREPRPLDSISFCADCGRRMHSRWANGGATAVYNCGKHIQGNFRSNVGTCPSHHIQKKHLEEYVLDYLHRVIEYAKHHEAKFVEMVKAQTISQLETNSISMQKELRQANERLSEINNNLRTIYADRLSGALSAALFTQFATEHEAEQNALTEKISKIQAQIQAAKEQVARPQKFLNLVRQFTDVKELTPELVSALVNRVEVGELIFEGAGTRGKRTQSIDVILNIIGNLTIAEN